MSAEAGAGAGAQALAVAREALAGEPAWVVGGAVRDALLGRPVLDLDLVVDGDAGAAARRVAAVARGPAFELSDAFGSWRVIGPRRAWQIDISPLRGGSLAADLAERDFTINAMAQPLAGGEIIDPTGGREDLAARRLRMVSARAFADDPLRVVRAARLACELELTIEPTTIAAAREHARRAAEVAQERVFAELKRIVTADRALEGLALLDEVGGTDAVLPELSALRGVGQNTYHHRDVHGHTLEVLAETIAIERDPAALFGPQDGARVAALLAEPLADDLTRGGALRFGALLHDVAKPRTRIETPEGRIGFPHHDELGAEMARDVLTRLRASERLRAHVAALARHHLRLGFLVHQRPLSRRDLYAYLTATQPVEVDVTLLSVADRLATRGRKADESIAKHLELAREVLHEALDWHEAGPPPPLLRGDELAAELGIRPGPEVGRLLREIAQARFAGEVTTREDAVALARRLLAEHAG